MSTTTLKLIKPDQNGDTLLLERRRNNRRPIRAHITSLCVADDEDGVHRNQITPLEVVDISDTGLGVLAPNQLDINTDVIVVASPHNGFDLSGLTGRVVRCRTTSQGHVIGIRLDKRNAA